MLQLDKENKVAHRLMQKRPSKSLIYVLFMFVLTCLDVFAYFSTLGGLFGFLSRPRMCQGHLSLLDFVHK